MASELINIDGGVLEGGGQILRNAVALSSILGVPICIKNIRAGRDKPGLRPQHLSGIEVVRDLCHGKLVNAHVGSTEITFHPHEISTGSFLADTKTAGSVCLLMQAAMPCMFFARGPVRLQLRGGTNASFAPPIDYFFMVLQPMLKKFGVTFNCKLVRRGFYPRGGGEVTVETKPLSFIEPFELLDRGDIRAITGLSFVAGTLPVKMASAMADTARSVIRKKLPNIPMKVDAIKVSDQEAFGNGSAIILVAETTTGCYLAGSSLGSRGVSSEDVGRQAAEELLHNVEHGGCVDDYLQDQLIIFMALARGKSRVRCGEITLHTETAIHVAKLLLKANFTIHKESGNTNVIECDGIGFVNNVESTTS